MTTTATTLEAKIQEMEVKMPGVSKMLQPKQGSEDIRGLDRHYTVDPTDVAYTETEKYKVVATKWEEHNWYNEVGGIEWIGWLRVYHQPKEGGGIKVALTPSIKTRDANNTAYDKPTLWGYDSVSLQPLEDDTVRIAWANKNGHEGPAYELHLETRQIKEL